MCLLDPFGRAVFFFFNHLASPRDAELHLYWWTSEEELGLYREAVVVSLRSAHSFISILGKESLVNAFPGSLHQAEYQCMCFDTR